MKTGRIGVGALALTLAWMAPLSGQAPGQGAAQQRMVNRSEDPLLASFRWREIGPIGQGGRVDDVAVVESDPRIFYVGFATAGVWKTVNNGTTFEAVFDVYATSSIGDIAIAQSRPDVVYVGTGEPNNRQSSSFGDGIYRTTDGGRTFTHVGLRETQTIARIIVHPTNPDVVWVASPGHLFGANAERGVYKTTDGGRTWRKALYVDENTGATELVIDPSNPNTLFAATYQRRRTACCFVGGGPGSGIWRSDDGGENWTRLSGNGLPNGTMGRVALAFAPSNPDILYAQIEVAMDRQERIVAAAGQPGGQPVPVAGGGGGRGGGAGGAQQPPPLPQWNGIWRSTDKGRTWEFRSNQNQRPMYFSQIAVHAQDPEIVYVAGVNAMKSTDGARTFTSIQGAFGHVDHHSIWVNPRQGDHVIFGNDGGVDITYDGGRTGESLRTWAVAQSYHASVDMRRPYHVCTGLQDNGSWCGPNTVRSGPILAQDWYRVQGSDGFYTAVDPTNHHIVYSESQNGGVQRRNLATGEVVSIRPRLQGGGGGQGGGLPSNLVTPMPTCTQQRTTDCSPPFRWNWNTAFTLSPHDPAIVHLGGNRFFTSYNRGETWTMSPDLTRNEDRNRMTIMGVDYSLPGCDNNPQAAMQAAGRACIPSKGDGTSWAVISTVSESPVSQGVLWAGTDDGNIQVSRDHGATWAEVGRNIPGGTKGYNISRVEASYFDPATAYVSIDGHRSNDLRPYVYVTRDYGRSWQSIAGSLPEYGNVNTVRQDPRNRNLLYAGTEFGFFISLDEGRSWKRFMNNLGTSRIDDVLVHPRENDLVLATHARGIQIMDDISPLQQLTADVLAADAHLFQPREAVLWKTDARLSRSVTGSKNWRGTSAPAGTAISYYLKSAPSSNVTLTITDLSTGQVFRELTGTRNAGVNRVQWNLRGNPTPGQAGGGGGGGGAAQGPLAAPGIYRVTLNVGSRAYSHNVTVLEDVWMETR